MNFLSLLAVEWKKLRRSRILLILGTATVMLWIPSVLNADLNFGMQAEGISPEHNFLIQGFMGMAWFMFPASMVVGTVLLAQTERTNHGILRMLALPISAGKLCLAKYMILLGLAAIQVLMMTGMYYISAAIASQMQDYEFLLPPLFVLAQAGKLYVSSLPMIAFFWMLSVCIQTPIFSVGIGLASIVPSVLMINTKAWFLYPMDYPFYVITAEYGKLASNLSEAEIELLPWIVAAAAFTGNCMAVSCMCFGRKERKWKDGDRENETEYERYINCNFKCNDVLAVDDIHREGECMGAGIPGGRDCDWKLCGIYDICGCIYIWRLHEGKGAEFSYEDLPGGQ